MGRALVFAKVLVVVVALGVAVWLRPSTVEAQQPPTCGTHDPYNFNTFELPSSSGDFDAYKTLINLAVEGKLFPETLKAAGETVDFRYQGLESGPRGERESANPSLRVPPTIYYSIAWIEATWANAAWSVPWGAVGPTLRSFDCGFGIGQVTSGMANTTGTPNAKQALIGIHPAFNVAEGMRILAWHWNLAPQSRPVAGEGNPEHLEDWYYAIWGYNGFAFVNHPYHPNLSPLRGGEADSPIYHCWDSSAPSYVTNSEGQLIYRGHGDYTYPELVYGCMRHPPSRGGQQGWNAVDFNMPDFDRPEVAEAFEPKVYQDCYWEGPSLGCPGMDFPTSFPDDDLEPHKDIVPPTDVSKRAQYLGNPSLSFNGPSSAVTLEASGGGSIDSVAVSATNTGSFIAPFRIRTTASWLVVTDANGSQTRYLDGNLAIGKESEVVVRATPVRETKQGHVAEMKVTLVPERMPAGQSTATVYFEPLFGGGSTYSLTVTGKNNTSVAPTPTPSPTPKPNPPSHRITIGGIVAQESR